MKKKSWSWVGMLFDVDGSFEKAGLAKGAGLVSSPVCHPFLVAWVFAVAACFPGLVIGQENWPEYRGAEHGHALDHQIPQKLEPATAVWSTSIHGKGWSSPVVWGNQVWLTTATEDGSKMSAMCVDLTTGKLKHDLLIHENEEPAFCHPTNSYASPTPAIENGRVYIHFGSYGTTCLDSSTGKIIWQRTDFECDHFRGPASSPIIYEDLLIVAFDGADQQYVVGMEKSSGKTVWKTNREIEYGTDNGDLKKAYGTGAVFEIDGTPTLVSPSAVATIAYHAKTGKQLWIAYHEGMNASAKPLLTTEGLIVVTNGMGRMVALQSRGNGNLTDKIAWTQTKSIARKSSQLLINGNLYMNSDKGVISCLDAKTGAPLWQERVGGAFAASPIFDGKNILSLNEKGNAFIYQANPKKFELISKTKFPNGFKASPAVANGMIVIRSFEKLYGFTAR